MHALHEDVWLKQLLLTFNRLSCHACLLACLLRSPRCRWQRTIAVFASLVRGQVAAVEKEKEQINAQYLELWRKNYAQPSATADASSVSKVVELETALESREGRLKQLSLQV